MLTKMALAALVGTVSVGAFATAASAQERGGDFGGRGGFNRGRIEHVERGYGRGFERGRRDGGWERARYDYAPGRGYRR
jgi:hypothetical protein